MEQPSWLRGAVRLGLGGARKVPVSCPSPPGEDEFLGGTRERAAKIQSKTLSNFFQPTSCLSHPGEEQYPHLGTWVGAQPGARLAWGYWAAGWPAQSLPSHFYFLVFLFLVFVFVLF